ncbi:protein MALE DISCOVERER 2-like [Hevea brasiliensis]|uniref:protein MALE DISCOVERER 2-like n=1 Tax=Hevea brasiliensis TaxID=3981 RepID=UPI0025F902C9|nr:protein MALE DISCOVERER 2-like [Hevea brasiliensis]
MAIAYCLQYMHHDLNPPVAHSNLNSHNIFLTDDYAATMAEISFLPQDSSKSKSSSDNESVHSTLPPLADATECLNDKRSIGYLIDPTLKSFKNNELDLICEIIQECIQPDPRQRPTNMAEISFLPQDSSKSKSSSDNESVHSTLPPLADATECLNDKRSIGYLIDPTLKSFKNNELDLICEIIQECIQPDPRQRPTMKDITSKLREVIAISPD